MNKNMIANQPMTYGTRRLLPGDGFEASRRDANLLQRLGRATEASAAPLDHDTNGNVGGNSEPEASDELTALRTKYHDAFGKRPFHGWDANTLAEKIAKKSEE